MQEELLEKGTVINLKDGFVEIELTANDKCDECSAKIFCSPQKDQSKTLRIENTSNLKTGDHVIVTIMGKSLFHASLNLYLYPLLILISAIFIGTELFKEFDHKEIYSFLLSLIMIAIYYLAFFQIGKKFFKQNSQILVSKLN